MNLFSKMYLDSSGDPKLVTIAIHAIIALLSLIFLMAYWPFHSVPTGHRGVETSFGQIVGVRDEGLQIIVPWHRLDNFSVRTATTNVNGADGSTSDQQPVTVSLTVRYQIIPKQIAYIFANYSKDGDLSSYVDTASQEAFKAVTARYTAPELISKRAQVSLDIQAALKTKLAQYGAQVVNIDMRDFSFSKEYMDAINDKVTQEQKRQAAENKVKTVEAQQQEKVAIATAEAQAAKEKADGEAYAIKTVAAAQAEALRIQNQALRENKDVLELKRIDVEMKKAETWDGKLPEAIYAGAPIPLINVK